MHVRRETAVSLVALLALLPSDRSQGVEQYKQISRESMARIVDGRPDKAIQTSEAYLKRHPEDLESMYVLAVAHAQKGNVAASLDWARKAIEGGLPCERFQAGPRDLLKRLTDSDGFQAVVEKHGRQLLHGPLMSGTDTEARFWVRTADEVLVHVQARAAEGQTMRLRTATGKTSAAKDFTTVVTAHGLEPNTRYAYELRVGGQDEAVSGHFRTLPKRGEPAKFTIGFGGGAGFTPQYERMWNTVRSRDLTAFLFLGDNVYIDNPTRQAVQKYCYYRRQSRPEFRRFVAGTPIFAVWDDHDFTVNDGWGGPDIHEPDWKVPVWRTYQNNWANPYYGGGEEQPGCWFDFAVGDVDFFMLDSRYYREKGRRQKLEVENPSMLGKAQKRWLFEKLAGSKATFKVIASPVPWAPGAKPGNAGMDTWEGFHEERDEIFAFLARQRIEGVLLISADRHRSDAWKIERQAGYPLYEFESSRLTNIHTHPVMPGSLFGYNKTCSFGMISFDTRASDPTVTYRVVTIDDEVVHTLSLARSQMTH
jgi:alkaline phosphatase D